MLSLDMKPIGENRVWIMISIDPGVLGEVGIFLFPIPKPLMMACLEQGEQS
jgi:hypothetical protein